jgi:alpha-1,2-mannosyltransferase
VIAAASVIVLLAYLTLWGRRYGLDLEVYRNAVIAWTSGHNPYLLTFTQRDLPYTYPPFSLLALSPLSWASFPVTQWLLWGATLAVATGTIVLVLRDTGATVTLRVWCEALAWSGASFIALEPARSAIDYGQIEFILMAVVVADLLLVPPRYRGIAIGLVGAVKLTPLSFIIVLAVSRDVKSVTRAAASLAACTGIAWLLWPGLSHLFWFHDAGNPARIGPITYNGNQCWYAIVHRLPLSAGVSSAAWLLLSLITLTASTFIAWRCVNAGQRATAIVAFALASLLASPISWSHHWIWVVLIPVLLLRHRGCGIRQPVRAMLWGLVALAIAAPYWWFSHGVAADIGAAVLPAWTAAALLVWSVSEFVAWRGKPDSRYARPPAG